MKPADHDLGQTIPPNKHAAVPPLSAQGRETVLPTNQDSIPAGGQSAPALSRDFGRYQILECLGQGAMGAVYKARDGQLDRTVALKIPKFSAEAEPGLLERFYREARSAATLSHPNICPVYDVGEYEGTHYISMGYIDGRPLSAFIKPDKPQPAHKAAAVVRKLAQALEEAHRQGIVHRDLKPDNVMIDRRGQPIIMDFGLAQQSKGNGDIRATQGGQILGTPAYMPPEQVDGDIEHIGPASDVYSLGVIFYELLTSRLPYEGSVAKVLAQIIRGLPEPPSQKQPGLDSGTEAICLKMMAADRTARYQSMAEVFKVLTDWLKGESPDAANQAISATSSQTPEEELAALFSAVDADAQPIASPRISPSRRTTPGRKQREQVASQPVFRQPWFLWSLAGAAAVLLLLGVLIVVRVGDQTVKIEIDDPKAQVFVDGDHVTIKNLGATIDLKPGEHNLKVRRGDIIVQTDQFQVLKGKNPILKISVAKAEEVADLENEPVPAPIPLALPDSKASPTHAAAAAPVEQRQATKVSESKAGSPPKNDTRPTPTNEKRFVNRGDYVEDSKTGLLWQKDGDASGKRNFYQARDYAKDLKLGGMTGWRVPTREELAAIFPATETPFKDTKYTKPRCCQGPYEWNSYWTSEIDIRRDDYAFVYQWYADGGANNCIASENFVYVRCVHDPVNKK